MRDPTKRWSRICLLGSSFFFISISALASDLNRLRAPMTPDGLFASNHAQGLFPKQWNVSGLWHYANNPLTWRYDDGTYDPVLAHQVWMELTGAVGLFPMVDLAVSLPIELWQRGPPKAGLGDLRGAAVGDLRVMPRVTILSERAFGVGLALLPELSFPTGDHKKFVGDEGVGFRPRLLASLPAGPVHLHADVGYKLRKNGEIPNRFRTNRPFGDEIELQGGAQVSLTDTLAILAELASATAATKPFSGDGLLSSEVRGGVRLRIFDDLVVLGGLGFGLTRGLGTPAYRIIFGISYAPKPPDKDGDGIPDALDDCPNDPEDYDHFEDLDGCPEYDNDKDGIPDERDACPNDPEDKNGIEDEDGCPETENFDRDNDGIIDREDRCPDDPEDKDGFEDSDGCPDNDDDHDGIPDTHDQCPDQKETINGIDDYDGCPDVGEGQTEFVERVKIEIKATVQFETSSSVIKSESKPLLDQVALQILSHPEVTKIRVEGHTDSVGPEDDNLYLSQDRADSVRRYLIGRGVDKKVLEAIGYGETRPITTNATREGRAQNRRVEFLIVETRR